MQKAKGLLINYPLAIIIHFPKDEDTMGKTNKIGRIFKSGALPIFVVCFACIIFFAIISGGTYLKLLNIRGILYSMVITGCLTIGVAYIIIYGEIDLSTGAVGTLCAIVLGIFSTSWGIPWYFGIIMVLILGALIGLVNAFFVNVLKIPSFIATLAMLTMAEGLSFAIVSFDSIQLTDPIFDYLGMGRVFGDIIPVSFIIVIVLIVIYGIMLTRTEFGRTVYLCGGNRLAANLAGLRPTRISYILFANCGMLASLAGVLFSARIGAARPTGITGNSFTGITAAILGGVSFGGGKGNLLGCFLGIMLISCFNNGMVVVGMNHYLQDVANGGLLLIALFVDHISISRRSKTAKS